ncbi:diguanylate cyclase domain-containing protein [Azotosporobacter soli]|uniref:diguanylate cyclase domain-containing protein n=1 Tax=Azotosporobacter soli TaxID=3055040 RepID=UPI0031FF4099
MDSTSSGSRLSANRIVAIYLLASLFWIGGSDYLVALFFTTPSAMMLVSMFKGWLYVALITALLYWLLHRYADDLALSHQELLQKNAELSQANDFLHAVEERLTRQVDEITLQQSIIHRQNEYLLCLHETALHVMEHQDICTLMQTLLKRLTLLLDVEHAFVAWTQEKEERFALGAFVDAPLSLAAQQSLGLLLEKFKLPLLLDAAALMHAELSGFDAFHAVLAAPLFAGQDVIGFFALAQRDRSRHFAATDKELVSRFAQLASLALENARLHAGKQTEIQIRKLAEENARQQAKQTETLLSLIPDLIFRVDGNGTYLYCKAPQMEDILPFSAEELVGKRVHDVLPPELGARIMSAIERTLQTKQLQFIEYELAQADGQLRHWEGRLLYANANEIIAIVRDITCQNEMLLQLQQLSIHDALTGLFNRSYFQQQLLLYSEEDCLPLTIFVCDIDGLKLINDTLGHQHGDQLLKNTAQVLQKAVRQIDTISRIGGDEFAIILPHTGPAAAEAIYQRIVSTLQEYNNAHPSLPLGLSIGFATAESHPFDINLLFREADDQMYQQKHLHKKTSHGNIISGLISALAEHDFYIENHTPQLPLLVDDFALELALAPEITQRLQLLACFHDIGRMFIPENLPPGSLDTQESSRLSLCEAGSRIALVIPELVSIADLILRQQEHWDGSGQPLGLSGEAIPLECRIFAIINAYDSALCGSAAQRPLSPTSALTLLEQDQEHLYDPHLLAIFCRMIRQRL